MSDFFNREQMWFGTEQSMRWIETPQTGADVSPIGFGTSATNLNGGGYVRNSWDSHKVYNFSWGESASPSLASLIHAYRNGTYGRTLIYFHDPMYYQVNVLPRRVADPSMAINYEAAPLVRDLWPRATPTGANPNNLPVQTAIYDLPPEYDGLVWMDETHIPIPPDFTFTFGAVYTSSNSDARIYYRTPSGKFIVDQTAPDAANLLPHSIVGEPWVRIGMENVSAATTRALSVTAMMGRLLPPGEAPEPTTPWMSGEGHSGCEFQGNPTMVNYNGVNGGQVGIACTLVETGVWK